MAKLDLYPSTLTDKEWSFLREAFPPSRLGRPPRYSPRLILNAILYVVRIGCTWRMMPHEFPHWRLVYYYFSRWQTLGIWQKVNLALVQKVRVQNSKKAPSAAVIDSQSVKMACQRGKRGFDAGKKILGRKRHILVDTLGLLIGVVVHPANLQDRDGAKLLGPFLHASRGLEVVFADGSYAGALVTWIKDLPSPTPLRLEMIKRPREATGFHLLPTLGRRTHFCLAGQLPPFLQRLRSQNRSLRSHDLPRQCFSHGS